MAVFIPVPETLQLQAVFKNLDQVCENVHHLKGGSYPFDQLELEGVAEAYRLWWLANWQTELPTTISLEKIIVTDLSSSTGLSIEYTHDMPMLGTDSAALPLPGNVTYCVTWVTGLRGRSFRGRTYAVGLDKGATLGNYLNYAAQTAFLSKWQALLEAWPSSWVMGVVSRHTGKAPRTAGVFTEIQSCTINSALDSQRRRLAGRGQ